MPTTKRSLVLRLLVACLLVGGLGVPGPAGHGTVTAAAQSDQQARPELVLQVGHSGSINAMALSSDGRFLISGSSDATIKLWEIGTGNVLRTFAGHEQSVLAVALSGDGKWIASGGEDSSVRLWNVTTGEMSTLGMQRGSVRGVAFGTDSRRLTSLSAVEVKQWDLATRRELRSTQLPSNDAMTMAATEMTTATAITPDGRLVATAGGITLGFGGTHARPIRIVDAATGREVTSIKAKDDRPYVTDVRLSPDGRLLAATATNPTGRTVTAAVVIYDATTGRELKTLATTDRYVTGGVQFSPDGKILASRSGPNIDAALARPGNSNPAAGITSLSGSMKLLDVGTWREIRELPNTGYNQPGGVGLSASPLCFSGDGRLLAVTVGSTVALFDTANGSRVKLLRTTAKAAAISARPMGQAFADARGNAAIDPDELRLGLDSSRESLVDRTSRTVSAINFSYDGRWLSSLADYSDWDTASGTPRRRVSQLMGKMFDTADMAGGVFGGGSPSGAVSPDGKLSASYEVDVRAGKDSRIVVRDVASGDVVHTIVIGKYAMKAPKELGKDVLTTLGPEAFASPIPVRFAFGERGIVTLYCGRIDRGPEDCHVKTLDPATGKTLADRTFKLDKNSMSGSGAPLVLTADGRFLVLVAQSGIKTGKPIIGGLPGLKTNPYDMLASYSIKIADAASGRQVVEFKVETRLLQSTEGLHLAFSPGGHTVAVESVEKKRAVINLFDLAGRRKFAAIGAEPRPIESMTLSWDDKRLAVRYSDPNRVATGRSRSNASSEVIVYDVASGRRVATLAHDGPVEGVTFSPTSQIIATLGQDGSKVLWDAQKGEKLATLVEIDTGPIPGAGSDWLVVTPDGLFDGSAAAWQQIAWRFSQNTFDVGPVEMFFNDFFYPGLAAEIFAGRRPEAPRNLRQVDRRPPTLRVVPAASADVSARMLSVKVEVEEAAADATHAQAAGARDVRLFRNGTLVKVWHGDVLNGQPRRTLDVTLPIVAGQNHLTAYAFNRDNVKSVDASAVVTGRQSLARKGTAYVLAVGVNHYENSQYDLKYAGDDATAFADEVQKQQAALDRFERVEVIQLLDQNATKANVLLALRRLSTSVGLPPGAPGILTNLQQAQPEDAVIIYFAGHGTARGARFFLVPHDLGYAGARTRVDAQSVETILSHSISDLELESAIEELDAGDLILVIDACNSGQALEAEEKRRGPMNSKGLAQLAYEKGLHILAAAQSYQAAMEASQLGHGYLTFALIEEGLKNVKADGEEKDGVITVREWFDYAARRVPQMQQNGVDGRLLLEDTAAAPDAARVKNFQQPRAFYRPETDVQPVIIGGKPKMPFRPQP